jgi:hypothetical protein
MADRRFTSTAATDGTLHETMPMACIRSRSAMRALSNTMKPLSAPASSRRFSAALVGDQQTLGDQARLEAGHRGAPPEFPAELSRPDTAGKGGRREHGLLDGVVRSAGRPGDAVDAASPRDPDQLPVHEHDDRRVDHTVGAFGEIGQLVGIELTLAGGPGADVLVPTGVGRYGRRDECDEAGDRDGDEEEYVLHGTSWGRRRHATSRRLSYGLRLVY